jgi:hypothetical protein
MIQRSMQKPPSRKQVNIDSASVRRLRRIWLRLHRVSVIYGMERHYFRVSCAVARRILGSALVQKVFFPRQVKMIEHFLQATNLQATHTVTATVQQRLLESTLLKWRYEDTVAELRAEEVARDFVIENWSLFEQAHRSGRGVLFTLSHYGLPKVLITLMQRRGYHGHAIRRQIKKRLQAEAKEVTEMDRVLTSVSDLLTAQEALTNGGIAYIVADGGYGVVTLVCDLFGRVRPFRGGFAELALATGAVVVPVTAVPRKDGQVVITFFEPLDSGSVAMGHQARIEHLITQYAEHLAGIYARSPGSIYTTSIHRFLYDDPNAPAERQKTIDTHE